MNKPFYSLDRADADGFQMKNGGTSQILAGLFARFDDGHDHILEIPPRLVDVFPLGRSIFWLGGGRVSALQTMELRLVILGGWEEKAPPQWRYRQKVAGATRSENQERVTICIAQPSFMSVKP